MQLSAESNGLYLQTYNFDAINDIRHEIEPFILHAAFKSNSGRYSGEDILKGIESEKQQVWLARRNSDDSIAMVCLTEVRIYPQKKALYVSYVVGSNNENWMWILDIIEAWGKEKGCDIIEAEGREGWKPIVKPRGYKPEKILYTKELI